MKITILYDNTTYIEGGQADWGFSCLIELSENSRILFDTGACGHILLENMKKLNINPESIDTIFISHNHFDHTGGLSRILYKNPGVEVYIPSSFKGVKRARKVISVSNKNIKIKEDVYSTGELNNIEQSVIIKTQKGVVIVTGCSHPGVKKIMEESKKYGNIYALIGGLHGFKDFQLLNDISLICPTHCTQKIMEIKNFMHSKYIEGGVGREITI